MLMEISIHEYFTNDKISDYIVFMVFIWKLECLLRNINRNEVIRIHNESLLKGINVFDGWLSEYE